MPTMTPLPDDDPRMVAWNAFRETEEFKNALRWASCQDHVLGSLWANCLAGWEAGRERTSEWVTTFFPTVLQVQGGELPNVEDKPVLVLKFPARNEAVREQAIEAARAIADSCQAKMVILLPDHFSLTTLSAEDAEKLLTEIYKIAKGES